MNPNIRGDTLMTARKAQFWVTKGTQNTSVTFILFIFFKCCIFENYKSTQWVSVKILRIFTGQIKVKEQIYGVI